MYSGWLPVGIYFKMIPFYREPIVRRAHNVNRVAWDSVPDESPDALLSDFDLQNFPEFIGLSGESDGYSIGRLENTDLEKNTRVFLAV